MLLHLFACSDAHIAQLESDPEITVTSHQDGDTVPEGPLQLVARVDDDDHPPEVLDVQWSVDGEARRDGDRFILDAWVDPGEITVTVEVLDPDLNAAHASVQLTVSPNTPPTIAVVDPQAWYAADQHITLDAHDAEDGEPGVTWVLDGATGSGLSVPMASLDLGSYTVDAAATDVVGATATTAHSFEVILADADGDGHRAAEVGGDDCDDADDTVYPGADEWCDEVDQDCDGAVDESAVDAESGYADLDGDGWGGDAVVDCFVAENPPGDCDDTDLAVNPDAEEVCNNGIDDNCDGTANACGWADTALVDSDITLQGPTANDEIGAALAFVPDLDGDGDDELLVGAPRCDATAVNAGCAWLVLGDAGLLGTHDIATADMTLQGEGSGDYLGSAVGAGDVDGDGAVDLVLGAVEADTDVGTNAGAVYLVWGPTTSGTVDLTLAPRLDAETSKDLLGGSLAVGDLDGDGLADVLAGAENAGTGQAGAAYVALGPGSAWTASIHGEANYDHLGAAVQVLGDTNQDGYDDFMVSAPDTDTHGGRTGSTWLFLGSNSAYGQMAALDPGSHAHAVFEGTDSGQEFGTAIAAPGDADGSGKADLAVGAPGQQAAYLFLDPVGGSWDAGDADASWTGDAKELGAALVLADVDGDGSPDVLAGAPGAKNPSNTSSGVAFLWTDLASATTSDGSALSGEKAYDDAGSALAAGGDLDGDGFQDLAVGAPGAKGAAGDSGVVYILLGRGL